LVGATIIPILQMETYVNKLFISLYLMLCAKQMVVVYLLKQDVESFYLGNYFQNGVTYVKIIAL
jgi:hypothetical protein